MRPGYFSAPIFEERLVCVAQFSTAADSPSLITTDCEPGKERADWILFAAETDLDPERIDRHGVLSCTRYILAPAKTEAGLGVALVPDFLAADALAMGRLRRLHPAQIASGRTYQVCYKEARKHDQRLRQFAAAFASSDMERGLHGSALSSRRRAWSRVVQDRAGGLGLCAHHEAVAHVQEIVASRTPASYRARGLSRRDELFILPRD